VRGRVMPLNRDGGCAVGDTPTSTSRPLPDSPISLAGLVGLLMGGWRGTEVPSSWSLLSGRAIVSTRSRSGFVISTLLLCVGSLNLSGDRQRRRRSAGTRWAGHSVLDWHGCRCSRGSSCSIQPALAETNRRLCICRRPSPIGGWLCRRILIDALTCCSCLWRVLPIVTMCALTTIPVPRRLAAADRHLAAQPGAGSSCFRQGCSCLRCCRCEGVRAAAMLRH